MEIEVVRSARRSKTVQARMVEGKLRIAIPAHLSAAEESHWVDTMTTRFERRRLTKEVDLAARARQLAALHDLPLPRSIEWSDRQATRWGSCSVESGRIRISRRLAGVPTWVIDYVVVHELAHLAEPSHSPRFWGLVARYPMAERARGYLMARVDLESAGGLHGLGENGADFAPPAADA
jgi:predicted metal-dependent hydrolase